MDGVYELYHHAAADHGIGDIWTLAQQCSLSPNTVLDVLSDRRFLDFVLQEPEELRVWLRISEQLGITPPAIREPRHRLGKRRPLRRRISSR